MALIALSQNFLAVALDDEIRWRDDDSRIFKTFQVPIRDPNVKQNIESNVCNVRVTDSIQDIVFSKNGDFFAVLTSFKQLFIYSVPEFDLFTKHNLPRAASKVTFSFDSELILVADKTGDTIIYVTKNTNDVGNKILGHLSLLTDILMTPNSKFIITCDRDEKIKVSNYPGTYNIEAFCVGHKEFVTSLSFLPHNVKYLLSASGDGTVKIWEYLCGKEICSISIQEHLTALVIENHEILNNFKEKMKRDDVDIDCLPVNHMSTCIIDNNSSLLAVSVHMINAVLIFKITTIGKSVKSDFLHKISLEDKPMGFVINEWKLYVYLKGEKMKIQDWHLNPNCEMKFCEVLEKYDTSDKVQWLQSIDSCRISVLYKRKFDNLQEYHKRKKQRLGIE